MQPVMANVSWPLLYILLSFVFLLWKWPYRTPPIWDKLNR